MIAMLGGIVLGLALVGGISMVVEGINPVSDWQKWTRKREKARIKRRSPALRALRRATVAVTAMSTTKARIRQEERQHWSERYEELCGEDWRKILEPVKVKAKKKKQEAVRVMSWEDMMPTSVLQATYGYELLQQRYADEGGLHLTTCPYECDCPPWARRKA